MKLLLFATVYAKIGVAKSGKFAAIVGALLRGYAVKSRSLLGAV